MTLKLAAALLAITASRAKIEGDYDAHRGEGFGFEVSFSAKDGETRREFAITTNFMETSQQLQYSSLESHSPFQHKKNITLHEWVRLMREKGDDDNDNDDSHEGDGEDDGEGGEHDGRRRLNVFTPDDRIGLSRSQMMQFPARAVGLIEVGNIFCTGTLIHEYLVLTNRHCLGMTGDSENLPSNFWTDSRIRLGRSDGSETYVINFHRVRWSKVDDYAIIQLDEPLGVYTGYVGIRFRKPGYFQANTVPLAYIGYSADVYWRSGRPGASFSCKSRGVTSDNKVLHDCDTAGGSSGSAMFDDLVLKETGELHASDESGPHLTALNFAEFRPKEASSPYIVNEYQKKYANVAEATSVFERDVRDAMGWSAPKSQPPTFEISSTFPDGKNSSSRSDGEAQFFCLAYLISCVFLVWNKP